MHTVRFDEGVSRAPSMASAKAGLGFGRQGEKAAGLKGASHIHRNGAYTDG